MGTPRDHRFERAGHSGSADTAPSWLLYSRFALQPIAPRQRRIPANSAAGITAGGYDDQVLAMIAPAIDVPYYRVAAAEMIADGDDLAEHYHRAGWRAGVNPNGWFDTAWYLDTYHDIRDAGMNPLFHYLGWGRAEGRLAGPPGGPRRVLVAQAKAPLERRPGYDAPADAVTLDTVSLAGALAAVSVAARCFVVAVSHDCYVNVTGGMQVLIGDEQVVFNADRTAYLHLSPAIARMTFDPLDASPALLQVALDGRFLGLATAATVAEALAAPASRLPAHRLFVVHSVFGHRVAGLVDLARILRPAHGFFWLHDFSALCEGFNLQRNDVAYCHAPPPDSTGCRICIYGATRRDYLASLHALFSAVPLHVLAPGRAALDLFLRASALPFRSARVHENLTLRADDDAPPAAPRSAGDDVLRVAFLGFPMAQKGWPEYLGLLRDLSSLASYRFYHFANAEVLMPRGGLVNVATRVGPDDRFAMVRAVEAAGIDLVLMLATWPETFSYVTHEAFAAGADVVALGDSGNVADAVRRHGRGVVLRDAAALLRFFAEGYALDHARQRRAAGVRPSRLVVTGTTATVDLHALTPLCADAAMTDDPDLGLLLGAPPGATAALAGQRLAQAWHFRLPNHAGPVRLVSRRTSSRERRGVAVVAITLDGVAVALDDARLGAGWWPADAGLRWTDGDAVLDVGGASLLVVCLAEGARYRGLPITAAPGPAMPAMAE